MDAAAPEPIRDADLHGWKYFRRLAPLPRRLHGAGGERDRAGNRALHFDQYCTLILLALFSPLARSLRALSRASGLDKVTGDPGTRAVARQMMLEAQAVAERLGVRFPLDVDARIAGAADVGAHKPSTLVDLERGRPMEIDPLLGAVVEMGRLVQLSTPTCDVVLALVRLRARAAGLYAGPA